MGGSSLAPEVITRTAGADLTVLDSTDPHQVGAALADRLDRTVVVVASKSGGTVETDSHRRAYEQAFRDAGSSTRVAERIVVVTDPGSPLETLGREAGYDVVLADPNVGGRYSALSAFGLTPSLLAGADVERLLADARVLSGSAGRTTTTPASRWARRWATAAKAGRDKLVIADAGSGIVGFGDWAEQLVAESTGKQGIGILPVVVEGIDAPGFADAGPTPHRVVRRARPARSATPRRCPGRSAPSSCSGSTPPLSPATSSASTRSTSPTSTESKENTQKILDEAGDGPLPEGEPALVDGAVDGVRRPRGARLRRTTSPTCCPRRCAARSPTTATWP